MTPHLLWLRGNDLRIEDSLSLRKAISMKQPLHIAYFMDPTTDAIGRASACGLHGAIEDLANQIEKRGGRLQIIDAREKGIATSVIDFAQANNCQEIVSTHRYDPQGIAQQNAVKNACALTLEHNSLLCEPDEAVKADGTPYRVFTPFYKNLCNLSIAPPFPAPAQFETCMSTNADTPLSAFNLLPKPRWDKDFYDTFQPTQQHAIKRLKNFLAAQYQDVRDIPSKDGTSKLSTHLRFGQVSARQAWHYKHAEAWRRQLVWRDFAHHLLYFFPNMQSQPLDARFKHYPWRDPAKNAAAAKDLHAWQMGETGYPLVDAGMKQLWHSGWMHNRVRMVAASFLTKHLQIPWQYGEQWFFDTLLDACPANNSMGWQWVAGCGVDAAPYFRVFNPESQLKKFDKDGIYIKKWLNWPDYSQPQQPLTYPQDYPHPIVEHAFARTRALDGWDSCKNT